MKSGLVKNNFEAKFKEQQSSKINHFNETYFLVLLEKKRSKQTNKLVETIHMWKIEIVSASALFADEKPTQQTFNQSDCTNTNVFSSFSNASQTGNGSTQKNRLTITSTRVCQQELQMPDDVYVVCADSAAADLSSSAMFTLNKVPYLFSTACSDGRVRFWSCKQSDPVNSNCSDSELFEFFEWELNSTLKLGTDKEEELIKSR